MIVDPMGVAKPAGVLVIGVAIVFVLERRLGECEHNARDNAEMKNLPHAPSFYTRTASKPLSYWSGISRYP